MAYPLSDEERAAFAEIVAGLRDPDRRRLGRLAVTLGATVLAAAFVLMVLLLHWSWTIDAAFSTTFLAGMGLGWVWISRRPLDR